LNLPLSRRRSCGRGNGRALQSGQQYWVNNATVLPLDDYGPKGQTLARQPQRKLCKWSRKINSIDLSSGS